MKTTTVSAIPVPPKSKFDKEKDKHSRLGARASLGTPAEPKETGLLAKLGFRSVARQNRSRLLGTYGASPVEPGDQRAVEYTGSAATGRMPGVLSRTWMGMEMKVLAGVCFICILKAVTGWKQVLILKREIELVTLPVQEAIPPGRTSTWLGGIMGSGSLQIKLNQSPVYLSTWMVGYRVVMV